MSAPQSRLHVSIFAFLVLAIVVATRVAAQDAPTTAPAPTLHPALFLIGDSITKTGTPPGDRGPWGMGYEVIPLFDANKIHVYNEGAGGRSSRGYIDEGLWGKILDRMQPGDFVIAMFAHNDAANSANYPDRTTITGSDDATIQIGVAPNRKTLHTYGWYMQQYVKDAKAKGGTVIICTPVPRNQWEGGKIKRGFDGYAQWAKDAAKASGAPLIDLNALSADKFDALGQEKTRAYFADNQHTTKIGAKLNAESVIAGIKQLKDLPLAGFLAANPPGAMGDPVVRPVMALAQSTDDSPSQPSLYIVGDSTAAKNRSATIQGWGEPFLSYFDASKIHVVNAALGGRSSRSYIIEGHLDELVAKLKPGDDVLLQWGHNDAYDLAGPLRRGSLHGLGEETMEVETTPGNHETLHTFGWYMRKQIAAIKEKGANPIILTLTVRDRWNKDGTIERLPAPNLDLTNTNRFHEPPIYSTWSAEIAKAEKLPLIDVHNIIADRYDKEGKEIVSTYFNSERDPTHRNPKGAAVDAECTLAGLKALKGPAYDAFLSDAGKAVPAASPKYLMAAGDAPAAPANRVTLFNGKDISGWRIFLGDKTVDPAKVWTITDGVIKFDTKASGYMVTEKSYSDYHLHVEWRWPKDAVANSNSGVLVHLNPPDAVWPHCFECQLKTGNAGQVVGMDLDIPDAPMLQNRKRAPKLADSSEKPLGEWNTYEIHCKADMIEVFINGVRQNKVDKLPVKAGAIALQMEGFPIEFRNVWMEAE